MSDRTFIDTNVFVYALDPLARDRKGAAARSLIRKALAQRTGAVSYQVIQELVNVALRKFETPMSTTDLAEFIDRCFRPMLIVHSSLELLHSALQIQVRYRLSWYDAVVVAAADEAGCALLLSEDLQHGAKYGPVRVEDPFRSLASIN